MDRQNNIFEIPEVARMIAQYLEGSKSMVNCLRVCRRWYMIFLPYNWASVYVESGRLAACTDLLVKYAPFIHKIKLYSSRFCNLPTTFPFLMQLETEFLPVMWTPSKGTLTAYKNSLLGLIKDHQQTLRELIIDSAMNDKLFDTVAGCSRLRKFVGNNFTVDCTPEQYLALHPRVWANVESLHLNGEFMTQKKYVTLAQAIKARKTLAPTKIKNLSFNVFDLKLKAMLIPLFIIMTSPELVRLSWPARKDIYARYTEVVPMEILAKAAKARALNCPRLQELSLQSASFNESDLASVMGALPSVTKLDLSFALYSFGMKSAKALTTDYPIFRTTLTELRLENCSLGGPATLEILASLSGLKVFIASGVSSKELVKDNRPWVCLGLERLVLGFTQDINSEDKSELFLERLAKLEKLEYLNVDSVYCQKALRLTLDGGLDRLKSLRSLTHLRGSDFHGSCFKWGLAEAEWVTQHWVNMRTFGAVAVDQEARKHFMERNVCISEY
ncbi:hypothetical protein EMPS_05093 [Entomortierella parvispora]|uniref:F-box domain-containing protein n=1 Tax=Entomortierella parvispora TaxID=205924 RepID=A0A9P3H9S4_9FUNG|nr:hypothetical protein EMPS_05093 [Entomortierella parvispora]